MKKRFAAALKMPFDFGFLLLILFLMPVAGSFNLMGKAVQVSDVLFFVYFLVWLPRKLFCGGLRLDRDSWIFCAMFGVFCLSAFFSPFRQAATAGLAIKAYLLSLAYVISRELDSPDKFKMALNAVLFSGIYVVVFALMGIVSFTAGGPGIFLVQPEILDLPLRFLPRVQSVFSSPSFLSSFLAIVIIFLVEKTLRTASGFLRRFYIVYLISSIVVFIFTFSRDMIGLGWGLIFYFTVRGIKHKAGRAAQTWSKFAMAIITVCVLVLSIWYVFPITIYKSSPDIMPASSHVQYKMEGGAIISREGWIAEKFVSFNSKLHNRFIESRDAVRTFRNYPVSGIGVGALPSQGYFPGPYSRSSHNTYLQVLAQTGLLGFAVSALFVLYLFEILRSRGESGRLNGAGRALTAILLVFLIDMFFADLDNFRYFWITAGLVLSLKNTGVEKNA